MAESPAETLVSRTQPAFIVQTRQASQAMMTQENTGWSRCQVITRSVQSVNNSMSYWVYWNIYCIWTHIANAELLEFVADRTKQHPCPRSNVSADVCFTLGIYTFQFVLWRKHFTDNQVAFHATLHEPQQKRRAVYEQLSSMLQVPERDICWKWHDKYDNCFQYHEAFRSDDWACSYRSPKGPDENTVSEEVRSVWSL